MTIVLYFSRANQNFVHGEIQTLTKGNTERLAEKISQMIDAPMLEIVPVIDYPYDYHETIKIVEEERNKGIEPEFQPVPIDFESVEHIFLGFPNWCGSMPKIVSHFLKQIDLSNKCIYPFCTHEGSAFGNSLVELKKICPNSNIQLGLPVRGSRVERADQAISNWISQYQSNRRG
ncbi:hypothetical protein IV487_07785 [Enterococcus saccharolyticus]|uniref:Flavodoxin-like domain-containing protein n=1 Tax=Candidatus Enterococcus willemsii TaxID=1857215 RepID=A0ABQ6YXS4_9ENTE|nr:MULTISPECIES: flavodoxin [Enterococcus]KAF1302700.1 hypothetical protein BAU17_05275 [Enterococcus sp. CU12B]MCD5002358.1 hypothetical protein [Enterococcus saccharolyticus]